MIICNSQAAVTRATTTRRDLDSCSEGPWRRFFKRDMSAAWAVGHEGARDAWRGGDGRGIVDRGRGWISEIAACPTMLAPSTHSWVTSHARTDCDRHDQQVG